MRAHRQRYAARPRPAGRTGAAGCDLRIVDGRRMVPVQALACAGMDEIFEGYRLLPPADAVAQECDGNGVGAPPDGGLPAARVWRAVRASDGAEMAIKVFPPGAAQRAGREADIAGAIDHPHIVRGSPVTGRGGVTGLVLPWLVGGSLADLLAARRRLRWPETLTVLIPLADALAAAHERGLVHGDLSPANILFDGDGRPMLADFGAARAATECGGEVFVTPQHVAPEIVRGADPGPAADLFSMGSVALACLTGRPAWPADDLRDVLIQATAGQWPELEENMAPPALRTAVQRLLEPEPTDRGSAAQLAVELRRAGDPEPVALITTATYPAAPELAPATVVRPDALRPPAVRWQKHRARSRRRLPAVAAHLSWRGAAAIAVVAAIAVGAVGLGRWWSAPPAGAVPAAAPADQHTSAATSPPEEQWPRVVAALDAARSHAFAARDAALLDAVYAPGSPALQADAERIAALQTAGIRPDGARHRVVSVRVVGTEPDGSATLAVVEDQTATDLYDSRGVVIGRSPAVGEATVLMHLADAGDGYRIRSIEQG